MEIQRRLKEVWPAEGFEGEEIQAPNGKMFCLFGFLLTGLLHQLSARPHTNGRTRSADWDWEANTPQGDGRGWSPEKSTSVGGAGEIEFTLCNKNLIRSKRSQFHISLLPTLFWMLGARLVLAVCHFRKHWNTFFVCLPVFRAFLLQ